MSHNVSRFVSIVHFALLSAVWGNEGRRCAVDTEWSDEGKRPIPISPVTGRDDQLNFRADTILARIRAPLSSGKREVMKDNDRRARCRLRCRAFRSGIEVLVKTYVRSAFAAFIREKAVPADFPFSFSFPEKGGFASKGVLLMQNLTLEIWRRSFTVALCTAVIDLRLNIKRDI
ncbi:hypothetical protein CEXT_507201 [Caerostris extrusa]|uniref:Secreted protein n=1 Tax=Caerostris extrusa TaxID=172846 RepID=A0AAV4USE1_CAEEX|nr:hypothetical protein CEXT_507201 [Caerostris extrusa]